MTARNQPHPLRCETCKNPDCPFGVEAKYCVRIIPNIMHKVGCASHSSATKVEQRIKDAIKELEKERIKLEKYPVTTTTSGVLVGMGKALALLRERGE